MKEIVIHKSRLQFVVGDITAQDTDAVVNAANSRPVSYTHLTLPTIYSV